MSKRKTLTLRDRIWKLLYDPIVTERQKNGWESFNDSLSNLGKNVTHILRLVREEQRRKCRECAIFRHKYLDAVISDKRESVSFIPKGRKNK